MCSALHQVWDLPHRVRWYFLLAIVLAQLDRGDDEWQLLFRATAMACAVHTWGVVGLSDDVKTMASFALLPHAPKPCKA